MKYLSLICFLYSTLPQPKLLLVLEFVLAFESLDFYTNVKTFVIDVVISYVVIVCFSLISADQLSLKSMRVHRNLLWLVLDVFPISNSG